MTIHKAILIPADMLAPIQETEFDDNDVDSWGPQVGVHDGHVSLLTYIPRGCQAIHDDIAKLRDEELNVNLRMNLIDAKLVGRGGMRLTDMLEGDFLMVGVDPDSGDSCDVPESVEQVIRDAHKEAVVLDRQVQEAEVRLKAQGVI